MSQITNPYRNPTFINLKDYCKIDGTSDDSIGFTTAYTLASSLGMGLFHPGGTLIKGNDTLLSNVYIQGVGRNASIIKLKNGANTDLFSAQTGLISLAAGTGTGTAGTLNNFGFLNITLDGNQANQSSGTSYPLRFYGYGFLLHNVSIKNGYSGGVLCDYNAGPGFPGQDSMESHWSNVKIHDVTGIGLQMGGPHDSVFTNIEIFHSTSHALHLAPNADGMQFANLHTYGVTVGNNAVSWLIESTYNQFDGNCEAEGSDTVEVVLLANENTLIGGHIFYNTPWTATGIQIGQQAGNTPYAGMINQSGGVTTAVAVSACYINTHISRCQGANGAIWLANDGGNFIVAQEYLPAGSTFTGSVNAATWLMLRTNGQSADGTQAKGGTFLLPINASTAMKITDTSSTILNVNTNSKRVELANGTLLRLYSDSLSTRTVEISNGTISLLQSTSAAALGNNSSITTSGVGVARVNPGGNVTGIIMQSGSLAGQVCIVVNESANSVTMDVAGTSHCAGGTGVVIAANSKQTFVWDGGTSLWY